MKSAIKRAALRTLKLLGVFALIRFATRKQLRILCYHGLSVGDQHVFEPVLFMRAELFERRLRAIIRQGWRVVDLDTAVNELAAGKLQPNTLVITIDDGWLTTLTEAAPLLKKYGLPATLYVTTYYSETENDVLNVALYYMAWKTPLRTVELKTGYAGLDGTYSFESGRVTVVQRWLQFVDTHLTASQRQELLPVIARNLQLDPEEVLANGRFRIMDINQVREIMSFGVDVQLHTHRHRLPAESFEAMQKEIQDNKSRLDAWTGQSCLHFCYPSGVYTQQQSEWLQQMGLKSSTTCDYGRNVVGQHPHRLKRVLDRDSWSDIEFEAILTGTDSLFGRNRN